MYYLTVYYQFIYDLLSFVFFVYVVLTVLQCHRVIVSYTIYVLFTLVIPQHWSGYILLFEFFFYKLITYPLIVFVKKPLRRAFFLICKESIMNNEILNQSVVKNITISRR